MNLLEKIKECVVKGHTDANSQYPLEMKSLPGVKELIENALQEKTDVSLILRESLIAGMEAVGKKYSDGEYFVPEMLLSAQTMKTGLKILEPYLLKEKIGQSGTVILGTVKGDMHDIGKNLVGMMLEGGGFKVIDLGINTPLEKFIEKAKEYPDAVLGMSALLSTTMENMKLVIDRLKYEKLTNKVIIGGAAVSENFAREIKADGYAKDAALVVPLVRSILS
ncbi:MAG TPA: corrinoid protein [Ignavibacteriaceae bacterium]|nr:corrinoid protein [Ignavibacteriaceae bacterium]